MAFQTKSLQKVGWLAIILLASFVVAHGCHGPDEDHEPVAIPVDAGRE